MLIGLIAGAIAAIVAALVSLPLHSPLDLVFNSLTVTLASLSVGLIAGLLWTGLAANPRRPIFYGGGLAALFIIVVVIAIVGNLWLERFLSFTLPLAVIVFALCGGLTPVLQRLQAPGIRWAAVVMVIACLGVGVGFAGQGDTRSGDLSLPERAEASSPPLTRAPTTAPTQEPTQVPATVVEPTSTTPSATKPAAATPMAVTASPAPPATEPAATTPSPATDATMPAMTSVPSPTKPSGTEATPVSNEQPAGAIRYVVSEGSEITFTVGEQLTRLPTPIEAVMGTEKLSGEINIEGEQSAIQVDLHSLASDQQYRDGYVQRRMFPDHPTATFTVDAIADLPPEFESGDTFSHQANGTLNLNDQDFPVSFDLEVRNDGDVLNVLGRTVFTWDDLQIAVPTARSVVWVEDEVDVQVLLVAQRR